MHAQQTPTINETTHQIQETHSHNTHTKEQTHYTSKANTTHHTAPPHSNHQIAQQTTNNNQQLSRFKQTTNIKLHTPCIKNKHQTAKS